jgi:hypothetical protein
VACAPVLRGGTRVTIQEAHTRQGCPEMLLVLLLLLYLLPYNNNDEGTD